MNRELKFRAVVIDDDGDKRLEYKVWPSGDKAYVEHGGFWMKYETIQQYTGLKDRNGREIFEGDILKWKSSNPFSIGEIRTVKVYYIEARFWCSGSVGVYLGDLLSSEKCVVIGNVFEHPELIPSRAVGG